MAPTRKTTSAVKRASTPDASAESPNKRGRRSETQSDIAAQKRESEGDDTKLETADSDQETSSNTPPAMNTRSKAEAGAETEAFEESKEEEVEEDEKKEVEIKEKDKKVEGEGKKPQVKEERVKSEAAAEESIKKEESKEKEKGPHNIIEKGQVYFFYRPKMDVDKPSGPEDVQKLYMLLSPDNAIGRPAAEDMVGKADSSSKPSHEGKANHRLLIVPQKTLPVPGKGTKSRVWAFVDRASPDLDEVENRLERYTYSTKTRGERTQESARLIGEARYDIINDQGHSHFVYVLAVPEEPDEVQQSFNIAKEGQFVVQVKNPEAKSPATERGQARFASLGQNAAKLPEHLQERFRGIRKEWIRFAPLDTGEFLDVTHVEIAMFAVHKDAKEEFAEAVKILEAEVDEELGDVEKEVKPEDHVYKELDLDESKVPAAAEEFT
ncbi:hypothetical protein BGX28_004640 [Mortierella sp. GBA30]|nr:hypothetical protein BGX28_004640 [Mortierella sp. GBA30]